MKKHYIIHIPLLFKTDGTVRRLTPDKKDKFSLEKLQELVGGYIAPINYDADVVAVVNEEGLIYDQPLNIAATLFLQQEVVGDVAIIWRRQL